MTFAKYLLPLCLCTLAIKSMGQTCTHTDLSKAFTFQTKLTLADTTVLDGYSVISVVVSNKSRKFQQVIRTPAGLLFNNAYHDCNAARSYSTGKNRDADVSDNNYGDFIVADFNFDGREDFAAKNDSGGNAGPLYNYYIQQPSGQFTLNKFLTQEMQFFPDDINKAHRTLTIRIHAGANGLGETVFQLNKAGKWTQVSHHILPVKQ